LFGTNIIGVSRLVKVAPCGASLRLEAKLQEEKSRAMEAESALREGACG